MKTKSIILVALLTLAFSSANAQFKFKGVGAGLSLGSQAAISSSDGSATMGFGINVNALASITDKIDIAGTFVYFFPSSQTFFGETVKVNLITISFDGHYNFNENFYALAGLNIGSASGSVDGVSVPGSTKVGINLGVGANLPLSETLGGFGEVGYTAGGAGQLFVNVGIRYLLK